VIFFNLIIILFIFIFFFGKFLKLIFFWFHHLQLNWLEIKLFDWVWFKNLTDCEF
jgi:hypothetical protein